jgi:NAD(P)H-hydrate repair Nnr-like enzyme with NAD(P)H-hydrate epimerase domain
VHMLGAATWPGHGINGGSGYIVARELLGTHPHAEKMAGAV